MSDLPTGWRSELDHLAVSYGRALPLDIVQAKGAGHAGTAVSLTPALYVLFQEHLRHDPHDPSWAGRDRFVLSCGHASLGLYLQLYLSGYGLELDDLRLARTFGSRTPGHPEHGHTAGVETTTGPLGQGVGNAVGMAMNMSRHAAMLDPGTEARDSVFGHRVWCFASDGDLEEGLSHEASSLAGTLGLEGLILVWDDNQISIEGDTAIAFTEDVAARYRAYGWEVVTIDDAEDPDTIRRGYAAAEAVTGRPVLIRLRTRLGHPMPNVGGTAAAHAGTPGADEVAATKTILGIDPDASFLMPQAALDHARLVGERGARNHAEWDQRLAAWAEANRIGSALLEELGRTGLSDEARAAFATLRVDPQQAATRVASSAVLDAVSAHLPTLWGGSADLAESNGVAIAGARSFVPHAPDNAQWPGGADGTLVHFGIREHAMGAILNGIALGGMSRPFGATFFVFSDYMRPSVRLAALMSLPVVYVWSHDSVAVGEDGPTHQPVEHLWSYRAIPGLSVVRPADWVETVDAWARVLERPEGPVALVLSRQALPVVAASTTPSSGAVRGAYVVSDAPSPIAVVLATGSEVSLALEAQRVLAKSGTPVRIVSAPCLEWFDEQDQDYRDSVLPPALEARVSVEAGTGLGWYRHIGTYGEIVSVESFGSSGAGSLVLEDQGITVEAVVAAVHRSLARSAHRSGRNT